MLCAICQALCSSIDPHQDYDFHHYETVGELRTSADSGCLLCKIIHGDLEKELNEPINVSSRGTIKTRRNIGIVVLFVGPVPRNDRKSPVVYLIFQSFDQPRKFRRAQS